MYVYTCKRGDFVNCEIKVGSVTNAQRGSKLLRRYGIKPAVSRIENPAPGDGCGFVITVDYNDCDAAKSLLYKNGIRIFGVTER